MSEEEPDDNELDTRPIWEGPIGNTDYKVSIKPVGANVHRAILHIYRNDDVHLYEKEVAVDRRLPAGGNQTHIEEWNKIIYNWVANYG